MIVAIYLLGKFMVASPDGKRRESGKHVKTC